MCGIVAYIGKKEAYPIVLKGLKRLEYRGYDSAGIALLNDGKVNLYKRQGKVSNLEEYAANFDLGGHAGIGHTRWATHGAPNDVNAHPHSSSSGDLVLIHNGIIENYATIKTELIRRGHVFHSDTDTEVLIHLIEEIQQKANVSLVTGEAFGAPNCIRLSYAASDEELVEALKRMKEALALLK